MITVAVAVNSGGEGRGNGSKRAVKWAVENLLSRADRFVLVHVMLTITHIPTSGDPTPLKDSASNNLAKDTENVRDKAQEIFLQYKKLFKSTELECETMLLENDNVAEALINCISQSGIRSFVMGSESLTNHFWRKILGPGITQTVLKGAPVNCDMFVVSRRRVKSKLATSPISGVANLINEQMQSKPTDNKLPIVLTTGQTPLHSSSSLVASTEPSSWSGASQSHSSPEPAKFSIVDDNLSPRAVNHRSSAASANTELVSLGQLSTATTHVSYEQFDLTNDVQQLRLQLRVLQDLILAQQKVQVLPTKCVKEGENIDGTGQNSLKTAEQDRLKYLQALQEEAAKNLRAKESCERRRAELDALKEAKERQKMVDAFNSNDGGTRRYTLDEIKVATDFFSEKKVIGEGGYGKVYKGILEHTPVAIKVLQPDATDKKKEFLREIGILSQLRHPNIVLLIGACSEMGCLVYEYMENGSLEEYIFCHDGRTPLPWFTRFRIAFEIACGLAFLHSKKPEPIVHRDLKPGNILLGRDFVSKISDVGLAKLLADHVPDSITMFGNSLLAGTLYYIDPEYQRTGTVRPKSDLYSFGVILLQLLTARHPNGLLLIMENAIASGSLSYMLDNSIDDWPLAEAEELTRLALQCCELRCRDRPDLETGVLPVLKKLADIANVADATMKMERNSTFRTKSPLLTHFSWDGFTYERIAIESCLERHGITSDKAQIGAFLSAPEHDSTAYCHTRMEVSSGF